MTLRPADANEATAAWAVALERTHGPTAFVLSRQGLPTLGPDPAVARGAYVVEDGGDCILIGTGAEVHTALAARALLAADGISARVVSMPSMELFRQQDVAYREEVLPSDQRVRVSVEAASHFGWAEWIGLDGAAVAIDRFGVSAPGDQALEALGITAEAVAAAVRTQIG